MPDYEAGYLLDYLFELGITLGDRPLDHQEIKAWMGNTGIELSVWEARTIKKLSEAYQSMSFEAKKIDAETPWEDAPYYMTEKYRKAMRVKNSLRAAAEV